MGDGRRKMDVEEIFFFQEQGLPFLKIRSTRCAATLILEGNRKKASVYAMPSPERIVRGI